MKIRTDFVTNSSSSSYVCKQIATFTLIDKSGSNTDITFKKDDNIIDGDDGLFSNSDIKVPELFNEFLIQHYKDTQKYTNASVLLNGLLSGKNTPLIKEFIKNAGMENISDSISYFCIENADVSSSMGSQLDAKWAVFSDNINIGYNGTGDYAEFVKAYKTNEKYHFIVFSNLDQEVSAEPKFGYGYDKDAECVFGQTRRFFAEGNNFGSFNDNWIESKDEIIVSCSKQYLPDISSSCNLPKDVLEAIESGAIKVLFFAKDTKVCDEIIWYSGELKKENIRIHLFAENEDVTDINDNTNEVNGIINFAFRNIDKTVSPIDKKEIAKKAEKEKQTETMESISSDVFNEPLKEEMQKTGKKRLVTVLFADNKKYKYFCEFPVKEGDKVFVEGKKAYEMGVVIGISNNLPKGTAAKFTLNVVKAFFK